MILTPQPSAAVGSVVAVNAFVSFSVSVSFSTERRLILELSEQARQAKRDYQREWRAKNKDKVRAYQQRHWENVAAKSQTNTIKGR